MGVQENNLMKFIGFILVLISGELAVHFGGLGALLAVIIAEIGMTLVLISK